MPDTPAPVLGRTRSSTLNGAQPIPTPVAGPSKHHAHSHTTTPRNVTEPTSAAAAALSSHLSESQKRPRMVSAKTTHARVQSWPSPPPELPPLSSSQTVPTKSTLAAEEFDQSGPLFPRDRVTLVLYTYRPSIPAHNSQPSPFPLSPSPDASAPSVIHISYDALPWKAHPGDYVEIRKVQQPSTKKVGARWGMTSSQNTETKAGGEALKGLSHKSGRDSYICRLGEDMPNLPINQIQVPESVASAFRFQNRGEVEVKRVFNPEDAHADFVELRFSQYLGRADMWRLAMSLEDQTVHAGEKLSMVGGAVRAEIQGIWRGSHRHASGILTAKTKTIYRSRSAQVYLFIQLCKETYDFDEDGERYYEKVAHGFLPELFARWNERGASHLVTIILFGRVHYTDEEVEYMERNRITDGLIKDYAGRWCKDFFRVVVDFERRTDWNLALAEIKQKLEESEKDILLLHHVNLMEARNPGTTEIKRILGNWSFAYEGNMLEAVNIALNPFDQHYIDRDLSRTGLTVAIITPGTGHFAVDKNLLRMTTERMTDHGICLDLVCLTKMPLHSVPLFSYVSQRPSKPVYEINNAGVKTKPATPDLLYFDAHLSSAVDTELADCYSIPKWVHSSFYSKTHDKPFRKDRFVPRCKMYEIQMLGILDHNLTTVTVPLLDIDDGPRGRKDQMTEEDRHAIRDEFDSAIFNSAQKIQEIGDVLTPVRSHDSGGTPNAASYQSNRLTASYQSNRLSALKASENKAAEERKMIEQRTANGSVIVSPNASLRPVRPADTRMDSFAAMTPLNRVRESSPFERVSVNPSSPSTSSLSMGRRNAPSPALKPIETVNSPSPSYASPPTAKIAEAMGSRLSSPVTNTTHHLGDTSYDGSVDAAESIRSGASTPRSTPVKTLKNKSSKSSFASRLGATWLFSSLSGRSQPSFPAAAAATVGRTDVSGATTGTRPPSPAVNSPRSLARPVPVPGAPIVTPSTPISKGDDTTKRDRPRDQGRFQRQDEPPTTQPLPIASSRAVPARVQSEDEIGKSLRNSFKASKSPYDSWTKAAAANFTRGRSHVTVNPCNPKDNDDTSFGEGRRWQYARPKPGKESQHLVKWTSLTVPACLPLTTDFMPSKIEIQDFYEVNSYDIACYPDQVSFLVRQDAANVNLPLAVMREMASQRLSQNFQFIVLPHDQLETDGTTGEKLATTRKVLLPGDSISDGLRIGGASEVLRNASGAIYLLWSNHIHRLAFDSAKQSVTIQRFVRKLRYSMDPARYTCLVWPAQMKAFQNTHTVFKYPNVEAKLNFNYLDRLIAGEEDELSSGIRYWRTRYILIPSGRDPLANSSVVPKGEDFAPLDVLITGAAKVIETIGRNQWHYPGEAATPLRLLHTTFDPSACVLDDGLIFELDRLRKGEQQHDGGKAIEGMTLQTVAEMMCQPNNGLVIRDRWWNLRVHESSFTGEQFCDWLMHTFTDIKTPEEATEWGKSLFEKGLIEHVCGEHGFSGYVHFLYRLRREYDPHHYPARKQAKSWFGGKAQDPRDLIEKQGGVSAAPLGKLGENGLGGSVHGGKKRKIKMSQSIILDLDPLKKSDRAEVAVLHADIIHNARNAFHFELNWLGVTAGLLDELRTKCAAQADRYGLRFVEAPVEQIKDITLKCPYRAAIPIKLALAPPVIPDLKQRLSNLTTGQGQSANWFEYAILTRKFGFVLDVEATSRYPDTVQVEYTYRSQTAAYEYSQFCHRSGLALVQCVGGTEGYLWSDNRLFIAAPTRTRGNTGGPGDVYPNAPVPLKLTKQEEARMLRKEFEEFCSDPVALKAFYDEITPPPLGVDSSGDEDEDEKESEESEDEKRAASEQRKVSSTSGGSRSRQNSRTSTVSRGRQDSKASVETRSRKDSKASVQSKDQRAEPKTTVQEAVEEGYSVDPEDGKGPENGKENRAEEDRVAKEIKDATAGPEQGENDKGENGDVKDGKEGKSDKDAKDAKDVKEGKSDKETTTL